MGFQHGQQIENPVTAWLQPTAILKAYPTRKEATHMNAMIFFLSGIFQNIWW